MRIFCHISILYQYWKKKKLFHGIKIVNCPSNWITCVPVHLLYRCYSYCSVYSGIRYPVSGVLSTTLYKVVDCWSQTVWSLEKMSGLFTQCQKNDNLITHQSINLSIQPSFYLFVCLPVRLPLLYFHPSSC